KRTPCRINSQSAKLICCAVALDTRSVLLLACGFVPLTLQSLDVAWCGLKQQLLQCSALVQTALNFRDQVLRNVDRKAATLHTPIQHPTRVLCAGLASGAVGTDAWSAAQAKRAENCRQSAARLLLEPTHNIRR